MNKLISILIILTLFGCKQGRKDSYSSKGDGRQFKLKFKDGFSSKLKRKISVNSKKDSYSSAPKKISFKWKDSFTSSTGRNNQLGFKDSFRSNKESKRRKKKRRGSYGTSPTKRIDFTKQKDSYSSNVVRKYKKSKRDSFSESRKKSNKGYKDPNKNWWNFSGKKARHGKKYKSRKSYSSSRKRKKIEKKKIKHRTDFEGL